MASDLLLKNVFSKEKFNFQKSKKELNFNVVAESLLG